MGAAEDVVIEWRSSTDPRPATPDIVVHGTGEVIIGRRLTGHLEKTFALSAEESAALLDFVFDEKDAWSIDGAAIEAEARSRSAPSADEGTIVVSNWPQPDSGTTVLVLRDGERVHEIRVDDLFGLVMQFPDLEAAARLRAIELRLLEISRR